MFNKSAVPYEIGESMSLGYLKNLVTRTITEWMEDNAMTYSAALAYYFVLSLPALLLFSVSIGSIFLKSENLQSKIINNLQGATDERIINMIILLFERIPEINSLSISALIGFIFLLWSASNVFRQLKNFLERAWDIKPTESSNIKDFIRDAIMSFVIVILFGGLLAMSIFVEGFLYAASKLFQQFLPFSPIIADYTGSIAGFLILVLFFILVYRVLPDKSFDLKSIFVGAFVTAVLVTIGKYVIVLFIAYSNPTNVYGAIGSIIGLFLLFYYSSIMITLGAEFTKVYSES
ncbi:YihY/virulence factor BrkB family protein [Methanosarcina barkeri]|uniref:Inner membrane protein YihY, formerly thought to be RNase BN n=4 Tax=Methanosarcina TaxID=2207 RepID=A0A0E3QWH1_METBA|nr:YihY/virulence factor BrkB family protein [Methanosarcina barkeri]AKB55169.1 Inner membrane protein YihY, formerly thought to be RNase BN [Methanosarcina barkeri MS]AKB56753.1 Inner membrane protein YihY, formerly thought to be RNase BN [Methanosarcina barkeri 227]AKJ37335.1 ribonuclease RN [Methanosarcina barkeri CM1]